MYGAADEILLEEIKQYKVMLKKLFFSLNVLLQELRERQQVRPSDVQEGI